MAINEILNLLGGGQGGTDYYGPATSRANDLNNQAETLRSQSLAAQPPAPTNPAYRSEDLLTGLLPALLLGTIGNPNQRQGNVEGFVQGYTGGKQKVADQKTALGQQKYQQDQTRREQQARSLETRAQGELRSGQAAQTAQDRRNATKETLRARVEQEAARSADKRKQSARTAFASAKNPSWVRAAGKAAMAAGVEEMNDELIGARIAEVEQDRRAEGDKQLAKIDKDIADTFGGANFIPPKDLEILQRKRERIAGEYGITNLDPLPGSATMKRQEMMQRQAQREQTLALARDRITNQEAYRKKTLNNWDKAFNFSKNKWAQSLAMQGNYLSVARARLALDEAKPSDVAVATDKYTKDIRARIDAITQDMSGLSTNRIDNAAKLKDKSAQRKFLVDQWREVDPVTADAYDEALRQYEATASIPLIEAPAPPRASQPPTPPIGGAMNTKTPPKTQQGKTRKTARGVVWEIE